jgi:hypothetical protein
MSRMPIEAANRRLQSVRFMSGPVDKDLFDDLVAQTLAFLAPGEKVDDSLPTNYVAAEAWNQWYRMYCTLKARAAKRQAEAEAQAAPQVDTASWPRYLEERSELLELRRRGTIDDAVLEYVGLKKSDFDAPTNDDTEQRAKYGFSPRKDWQEVAWRIREAIHHLNKMTRAERENVPHALAVRKLERTTEKLAARIQQLEEHLGLTLTGNTAPEDTNAAFH